MDGYLESHLRLADRRGVLRGNSLSRVQAIGMEMLMVMERREESEGFVDRFKLALVAHDPGTWALKLYPELLSLPRGSQVVTDDEIGEEDLYNSEGAWEFTEPMTPEEVQRIIGEMIANPVGTFDFDDLDENVDGVWQ